MRKLIFIVGWIMVLILSAATVIVLNAQQTDARPSTGQVAPPSTAQPGEDAPPENVSSSEAAIETKALVVPVQSVQLSFPNRGIGDGVLVQDVLVHEGDTVKQGDALAHLDTRDLQLRVENAQAVLAQARAEYTQIESDASTATLRAEAEIATIQAEAEAATLRAEADASKLRADAAQARAEGRTTTAALLESSAQTLLQAATALKVNADTRQEKYTAATEAANSARAATLATAQAKIQQAEATLKREQLALDLAALRSPIDGTVIDVSVKAGEVPRANGFAIVVADISAWQIEASGLADLSVVQIHEGDPATITFDALPNVTLTGKVARIKPVATDDPPATVSAYTVIITPDQQDERVRWNMTATVAIGTR
ncbi:MAG TPA: efflux RND transporter periplasmic adaptor subunit [Herpetosiphonaceae bacterium]